jgi:hypothetical protein
MLRVVLTILWPSFLAAGIGVGIVFTLLDPMELTVMGDHIRVSRTAVYSLGFFVMWAITAIASAMTWYLLSSQQLRGSSRGASINQRANSN